MIRHEGDPDRCAVILPGVRYFSQAPLLWFAREAAQAHGWSVVEVDERAPASEEPFEWMRGQAERALEAASGAATVAVIGKSLGSIAATLHDGPAAWLTPLLIRPEIVEALRDDPRAHAARGQPRRPELERRHRAGQPGARRARAAGPGSLAAGQRYSFFFFRCPPDCD